MVKGLDNIIDLHASLLFVVVRQNFECIYIYVYVVSDFFFLLQSCEYSGCLESRKIVIFYLGFLTDFSLFGRAAAKQCEPGDVRPDIRPCLLLLPHFIQLFANGKMKLV